MTHRAAAPIHSDPLGRFNQALLDHGGKAVTTSATGGVDLPLLLVAMGRLEFTHSPAALQANGLYKAGFTHAGAARGDQPAVTEVESPSRESAIVEAATAALLKL